VIVRYRDEWLVVVDKPAGLPTQDPRGGDDSLFTRLKAEFPYVALHHRLDAAASGLVLFTVHRDANRGVSEAFRRHSIRRTYAAVADGTVHTTRWERPIDDKPAQTTVQAVARGMGCTALALHLHTGRKHQLRVHASLAGHPLLGDRRYAGAAVARRWPRLALHATRLELAHPITDEPISVASPLPDDLQPLWDAVQAA